MTRTICLHGPESTGKSTLAPMIAAALEGVVIDEYGREWCETWGTELTMGQLVAIAEGHLAATREALRAKPDWLILDTDPLMTAVWADMLFGRRDPWFAGFDETADLYLLFDIDLPWIADGTRMFGQAEDRRRFFELSKAELGRRAVRWALVGGTTPEARLDASLAAIRASWPAESGSSAAQDRRPSI